MADNKQPIEAEARTVATSKAEEPTTEAQKTKSSADILDEMEDLARIMGLLSGGVEYLAECGAPLDVIMKYSEYLDKSAAETAADLLNLSGEARETFLNRETRTAQESEYVQIAARLMSGMRFDKYLKSNYVHSVGVICETASDILGITLDDIAGDVPEMESLRQALNILNRYFYKGLHKELNPLKERSLSEAEEDELRTLARGFLEYHKGQSKLPEESVIDFISPTLGDIAELSAQSDMIFLPLSKIYREQRAIGKRGADGGSLDVGKKSETVPVEAYITDKDGNPLNIDVVMQGVQSAIGQLIDENGRVLPITVTPQQVYRAYARLPNDAFVTKQQEAEMERALDALMFSPSRLDFTTQLEKHKKIDRQPDYDYTAPDAGRLSGNLITAEKGEATNRQGERQVAYRIYSYPVLYRYSHIIGQIAQVPNKLLTGGDKGAIKDKKEAETQRNALNIGMRKNVLTRITFWRNRVKKHQPITPVLTIKEIAEECNIAMTDKTERTLRKNIQLYLDELKTQGPRNGGIKGYQLRKYGRRVVGFYVEV